MPLKFNPFTGKFDYTGIEIAGVDNRIVRCDGTDGLQSSGVTLDDNDDISGVNETISFTSDGFFLGGGVHSTRGQYAIGIGDGARATSIYNISIGRSAIVSNQFSILIGGACTVAGNYCVRIGHAGSISNVLGAVGIGAQVTISGANGIGIGRLVTVSASSGIAIGSGANAGGTGNVSIGLSSSATGNTCQAVGQSANAAGNGSLALGYISSAGFNFSYAFGQGATTTATRQLVIGTASTGPTELYFGPDGVTHTNPGAQVRLVATGGSGTNINASDMILAAGRNTGNSTDSRVIIQTPDSTTSGTTLQTLIDRMTFYTDGLITAHNIFETEGGRRKEPTRVTSSSYNILYSDEEIFADTDSNAITLNLPAGFEGQTYRIINSGTSGNTITLVPNGSELLLGVNSNLTLLDGDVLEITYETTEGWY